MYCTQCGAIVNSNWKFCGHCGSQLDVTPSPVASGALAAGESAEKKPPPPTAKTIKRRTGLRIAGLACLFVFFVVWKIVSQEFYVDFGAGPLDAGVVSGVIAAICGLAAWWIIRATGEKAQNSRQQIERDEFRNLSATNEEPSSYGNAALQEVDAPSSSASTPNADNASSKDSDSSDSDDGIRSFQILLASITIVSVIALVIYSAIQSHQALDTQEKLRPAGIASLPMNHEGPATSLHEQLQFLSHEEQVSYLRKSVPHQISAGFAISTVMQATPTHWDVHAVRSEPAALLEESNVWWSDRNRVNILLANRTEEIINGVFFRLDDTSCAKRPKSTALYALKLGTAIRPQGVAVVRTDLQLPAGHPLMSESVGFVCGTIVAMW